MAFTNWRLRSSALIYLNFPRAISYSKGTFQSYFVSLDTLDRLRGNGGLAILQLWCNIDGFPLHWGLPNSISTSPELSIHVPYLGGCEDILY